MAYEGFNVQLPVEEELDIVEAIDAEAGVRHRARALRDAVARGIPIVIAWIEDGRDLGVTLARGTQRKPIILMETASVADKIEAIRADLTSLRGTYVPRSEVIRAIIRAGRGLGVS